MSYLGIFAAGAAVALSILQNLSQKALNSTKKNRNCKQITFVCCLVKICSIIDKKMHYRTSLVSDHRFSVIKSQFTRLHTVHMVFTTLIARVFQTAYKFLCVLLGVPLRQVFCSLTKILTVLITIFFRDTDKFYVVSYPIRL